MKGPTMALVAGHQPDEIELVLRQADGVMRWGVLGMIASLRSRPSEAFDDVARGKTRPWGVLLRRCIEAALAGSSREEAERLVGALQEALDLVWRTFGRTPRVRLRLLKPGTEVPSLQRAAA
jgi:hypothetical protein